ncbi:hypothetical protein [Citrobacter werkmanii]|uniref:hypothetical protein n=1 Tax=Citrobacter werkmanii TaxID=67827 RepID=UPI00300D3F50
MNISRSMNLIVPAETEAGTVYIHSTPISKEIYRQHFFILSKTFAGIFSEGLGVVAGPRIAYMMLEKCAIDAKNWDGATGVKNTLVNEIIRMSSVVYPVEGKGWDTIPLDVAIDRDLIDIDEVIGEIVFFICVYAINKPAQAEGVMTAANGLWGSAITSLNPTEWAGSLQTLKPTDSSGETENTSSAISSTTAPEKESEISLSNQVPT